MAKKLLLTLFIAAVIIAGLGFIKFQQIQTAMAQGASFQPPPEAVTTIVAEEQRWPGTLTAIGTVTAVQGVTVSADLPGTVARIAFDSGMAVREGQLLVGLDTRQERAQLAAAEAQRDLAKLNFERMQGLVDEGAITRAEYDLATAERRQTEARLGEIQATIARKTIRAPFSGVLGIRQVNLGQYLSPGEAVVSLQAVNPIYVDFGVPQQVAAQIRPGQKLRITTGNGGTTAFEGRVTAIDSVADAATRNVQVQATLTNRGGRLRPGMFAQVEVALGAERPVIAVPASAISHAPYGDSVFVVAELQDENGHTYRGVRQQFVKLDGSRGDQVAVVSGINPGDEVVSSGAFKLRNGAAVEVNNDVQPANSPAPQPEDS